jgi:hypothetical protein
MAARKIEQKEGRKLAGFDISITETTICFLPSSMAKLPFPYPAQHSRIDRPLRRRGRKKVASFFLSFFLAPNHTLILER